MSSVVSVMRMSVRIVVSAWLKSVWHEVQTIWAKVLIWKSVMVLKLSSMHRVMSRELVVVVG